MNENLAGRLVYVKYKDHVLFHRVDPGVVSPCIREATGWLVYESREYLTISLDRDAGPPTLKGGGPKATGLVLLRCDILELRSLGGD